MGVKSAGSTKVKWKLCCHSSRYRPRSRIGLPTASVSQLINDFGPPVASDATIMGVAVQSTAAVRRPAARSPARWKYSVVRNAAEKIAPECRNAAALAALNVRLRNRRSGTIGSAAVRSRSTNPASSATPPASRAAVDPSPHPDPPARTRPQVTASDAPAISASAGRSSRRAGPWLSGSSRADATAAANPIGTLTQKIQCQDSPGQPCR